MAKFKVLQNNQTFLNRVGISLDRSTNPTNKFFALILAYYVPVGMIIGFITSAAFVFKYPSNIKPALGALKIAVAAVQCLGMFSSIRFKMAKTEALQRELQEIVDTGALIFAYILEKFSYYLLHDFFFREFCSDFGRIMSKKNSK